MANTEFNFAGWKGIIEEQRVIVRKGERGAIFNLPKPYVRMSRKYALMRQCRIRDFDSIYGDDETYGMPRDMQSLSFTFTFVNTDREWIVMFVSFEDKVLVISGYTDWDGNAWGYYVDRLD